MGVYEWMRITDSSLTGSTATQMQFPPPNLESIRRDLAERLRPTCADMPDDDFEKMVARMALIEWKHLNDSTPTSQMISH